MKFATTLEARRAKRLADAGELQRLRLRVKELFEQVTDLQAENFYLRELVSLLNATKDLES